MIWILIAGFITGLLMVFYNVWCGYSDPNWRTSKRQDRIGSAGLLLILVAMAGGIVKLMLYLAGA